MRQRAWLAICLLVSACNHSSTTPPVPNYAGNWSGTYRITGCTETGDVASAQICSQASGTAPFTMTLAQSSTSPGATLSGNFALGSIAFPIVPATIAQSGAVTFAGTTTTSGITIVATWSLSSPLVGSINQLWTVAGVSGQITIAGTISPNPVKTTDAVRAQPLSGAPKSLQEVRRAVLDAAEAR